MFVLEGGVYDWREILMVLTYCKLRMREGENYLSGLKELNFKKGKHTERRFELRRREDKKQ